MATPPKIPKPAEPAEPAEPAQPAEPAEPAEPAVRESVDRLDALGQSMDMRKDPLGFLAGLAGQHAAAGIAPLRLGSVDGYLAFEPSLVELVLRSSARSFNRQSPVYRTLTRFLGRGILTSEGEFWRKHRRVVQPSFHRQRLRSFAGAMVRLADESIEGWGTTIDLRDEMMRLTLSVVGETLFGTDMRWMAGELAPALDAAQRHSERVIAGLIPADESRASRRSRRFDRAVETLDQLAYRLIDERRAGAAEGDDVLGMLLAARDEEGKALPRKQVRDEVITLVSAGHETTANALSWTLVRLSEHPDAWERLIAEVDRLGDRVPTIDDLGQLTYVRQVLDESLRLCPPVWMLGRIADEPVPLSTETIVAPGELVLLSPWVTHRLPELWNEPERFLPERWDPSKEPRHAFAFFPFGGGARKCVGEAFAYLEATLVLARIAQRARLELVADSPKPEPQLTLGVAAGTRMRVLPR